MRSVTVTPGLAAMKIGDTLRFLAAANTGAPGVRWTTQDPKLVGVDSTGLASAVAVTPYAVLVCATSVADSDSKGCATVTVTAR